MWYAELMCRYLESCLAVTMDQKEAVEILELLKIYEGIVRAGHRLAGCDLNA